MTDPAPVQIFFCKPPLHGRVKTRLAPLLGEAGACEIYKRLLADTLARFHDRPYVLYSAEKENADLFQEFLRPGSRVEVQMGGDLGARMAHAIFREARIGGDKDLRDVLLSGVDIPGYTTSTADAARALLLSHDAVLGPARDGGYYLIGFSARALRRFADEEGFHRLFARIPWSTNSVFEEQEARLRDAGLSIGHLPMLDDIDTPADFLRLRRDAGLPFPDIRAVLPVLNEQETLPRVLSDLQESGMLEEIICADNGSTDGSPRIAVNHRARLTICTEPGYGATCLTALADIRERGGCDIVLFSDADGSDDPDALAGLLSPILSGAADIVLGVRTEAPGEEGAVPPHARFGNLLACTLIRIFYGHLYHDLGPFRAVRWTALEQLQMDDRNFGWTVQMQVRALQTGLSIREVPVRARRRRGGRSKVSTTVRGSFRAGWVIITTIFRELRRNHGRRKGKAEDRG